MAPDPLHLAMEDLRNRLLTGRYGDLPALAERIEGLILGLTRSDMPRLHGLRAQAIRTAACVDAARNGLIAARRRIDEATGRAVLGTYDDKGARAPMIAAPPPTCRL